MTTATPPAPPVLDEKKFEWGNLLEEALTIEGSISSCYTRFHNYSLGNCILLRMQGVREPAGSFDTWRKLGRIPGKGTGKFIRRPMFVKKDKGKPTEHEALIGFKLQRGAFALSDTHGDELPTEAPEQVKEWSKGRALVELKVSEEKYALTDGNTQGYSYERTFAVSPLAEYPVKTMFHELGHILCGHTTDGGHRGIQEFQAEAVAYLVANELGVELMDASSSRAYIQGWLKGTRPSEEEIKKVFTVADKILRAGRV